MSAEDIGGGFLPIRWAARGFRRRLLWGWLPDRRRAAPPRPARRAALSGTGTRPHARRDGGGRPARFTVEPTRGGCARGTYATAQAARSVNCTRHPQRPTQLRAAPTATTPFPEARPAPVGRTCLSAGRARTLPPAQARGARAVARRVPALAQFGRSDAAVGYLWAACRPRVRPCREAQWRIGQHSGSFRSCATLKRSRRKTRCLPGTIPGCAKRWTASSLIWATQRSDPGFVGRSDRRWRRWHAPRSAWPPQLAMTTGARDKTRQKIPLRTTDRALSSRCPTLPSLRSSATRLPGRQPTA